MALTEKTLEVNITHELMALGHGIWQVLWSSFPKPYWFGNVGSPHIFAAGLSLKEELKYGWDVSLHIPSMGLTAGRVAFIQFKLGAKKGYSLYPGSVFNPSKSISTEHILFGINNNSHLNQHSRLREVGRSSGKPDAAIYAFPMLTQESEVRKSLGRLIADTLFFTVPGVDIATLKDPIVDGTKRSLAVSAIDPRNIEFRSQPSYFSAKDMGGKLIGDIVSVRVHRAMLSIVENGRTESFGREKTGRRIVDRLIWLLSSFCDVDVPIAQEIFRRRLRSPFTEDYIFRYGYDESTERRHKKFVRLSEINELLDPTLRLIESGRWEDVAYSEPETDLLISSESEEMNLRLREMGGDAALRLSYIVI